MTKFNTHVAVFFEHDNHTIIKYVTSCQGSTCFWDAGLPAMKLSESFAKDIVFGLTLNGYYAAVIQVVNGVTLTNPGNEVS